MINPFAWGPSFTSKLASFYFNEISSLSKFTSFLGSVFTSKTSPEIAASISRNCCSKFEISGIFEILTWMWLDRVLTSTTSALTPTILSALPRRSLPGLSNTVVCFALPSVLCSSNPIPASLILLASFLAAITIRGFWCLSCVARSHRPNYFSSGLSVSLLWNPCKKSCSSWSILPHK